MYLDKLDRDILALLQDDGRKPYTEIAKELGTSESTVRYRVGKLEADKVLQVLGMVDPHKAGFGAVALIFVAVTPGYTDHVVDIVEQYPEVSYLLLITGEYDLLVEVMCPDMDHLTDLVTYRLHEVEGIERTNTITVLKTFKVAQPDLHLPTQNQKLLNGK